MLSWLEVIRAKIPAEEKYFPQTGNVMYTSTDFMLSLLAAGLFNHLVNFFLHFVNVCPQTQRAQTDLESESSGVGADKTL